MTVPADYGRGDRELLLAVVMCGLKRLMALSELPQSC